MVYRLEIGCQKALRTSRPCFSAKEVLKHVRLFKLPVLLFRFIPYSVSAQKNSGTPQVDNQVKECGVLAKFQYTSDISEWVQHSKFESATAK